MTERVATRLATAAWTLIAGLSVATAILIAVNRGAVSERAGLADVSVVSEVVGVLVALACASIGAIVAARRPRNPIGWIFLAAALALQLENFGSNYAIYTFVVEPEALPGAEIVALLADAMWIPSVALGFVYLLMLFPDGTVLSARWRPVIVMATAGALLSVPVTLFAPGPLYYLPGVPNPLGVPSAKGLLDVLYAVSFLAVVLAFPLALVALVLRVRRAVGDERQQMKWFVFAAAAFAVALPVAVTFEGSELVSILFEAVAGGFPVAVGLAILKYRLYDIDRIINRTLVYAALSAVLAGIYALCVVVLPQAVGVGANSQLVVAGSTLLVAALFGPARRRIQGFIDRRFYRSRYDAQQTAEAFGERLRNEVALDAVTADLLGVVRSTLKPARASLWLRAEGQR